MHAVMTDDAVSINHSIILIIHYLITLNQFNRLVTAVLSERQMTKCSTYNVMSNYHGQFQQQVAVSREELREWSSVIYLSQWVMSREA